ncbi:MAG: glycosyl hydrolase [Solirubrobacteraceae bacterium]
MAADLILTGRFYDGKAEAIAAGTLDVSSVKVMALTDSYSPDPIEHQYRADIVTDEVTGGDYTAGGWTLANSAYTAATPTTGTFGGDAIVATDVPTHQFYVAYVDDGDAEELIGWLERPSAVAHTGTLTLVLGLDIAATVFTSDPLANAQTKLIQGVLEDMPNKSSRYFMLGQHLGNSAQMSTVRARYEKFVTRFGKPAWVGIDYGPVMAGGSHTAVNEFAEELYNDGVLITITLHPNNPANGLPYTDRACTFSDVSNPATATGATWLQMLGRLADALADLEARGVDGVMLRLWHEALTIGAWWSYRYNSTVTRANWIAGWEQAHDFIHLTRGIHNVLWHFSMHEFLPTDGGQIVPASSGGRAYLWPGGDRADGVGASCYLLSKAAAPGRFTADGKDDNLKQLRAEVPDKPFFLMEMGPTSGHQLDLSFEFIDAIEDTDPVTGFSFAVAGLFWGNGREFADQINPGSFVASSAVALEKDVAF